MVRGLLLGLVAILGLAACSAPAQAPSSPTTAAAPEWRVGDRWRHAWTAGREKGVKTTEVISVREVNGVRFYVVQADAVHRYYTMDLQWAANIVESRVTARIQPPQPWFMWPLEVGRQWQYQGTFEDQQRKLQVNDSYQVVAMEQVEVPAGTFSSFKIVRQGASGGYDQYWYSPDVRWYVKWVGRRENEDFQELLQEYTAAPRVAGASAPGLNASDGQRR